MEILEEAWKRVFEFFKTAYRSIPTIMKIYVLNDVAKPSELRSTIASEILKNTHVTDPKELKSENSSQENGSAIVEKSESSRQYVDKLDNVESRFKIHQQM